jgi:type II secretory ATPase GspE/PulE/Tfp pilus assembly ATPase PilB-like protein
MNPVIAETVFLVSPYKPIIFGLVLGLWAWAASHIDKDLVRHFMPHQLWNLILVSVALLAGGLWLWLPFFWLGLGIALVLLPGVLLGYHFYRNTVVPESEQWQLNLDSFHHDWDEGQKKKSQDAATVRLIDEDGEVVEVPSGEDPLVPVYEALETIFDFALPRCAERIEMLASSKETIVAVQIDGVRYPQTKLEAKIGVTLIDYIKKHAGLDVSDRRKKQKGTLKISHDIPHDLEVTTSGTTRGLSLNMMVDPVILRSIKFDDLGFLDVQRKQIEPALDGDKRAVLVVSPPHHGMTSTLYSFVARHDPYLSNVMSLEDEVPFKLEGVHHLVAKIGPDAPTMPKQLESLMLREPKVVLMSHLTDPETVKMIFRYTDDARFYVGLRQKDSFAALKAWASAADDQRVAGNALEAIISMRLLRKLCPTCRIAYRPDPALLKKLNLPADRVKQLYKHSGKVMVKDREEPCEFCVGLGYRGLRAVYEVMVLDDEARALIGDRQSSRLKSHLRKSGMLYMQEAALMLAADGITSVSEISRVLADK